MTSRETKSTCEKIARIAHVRGQEFDNLVKSVKNAEALADERSRYLAEYLAIRAAGFLETSRDDFSKVYVLHRSDIKTYNRYCTMLKRGAGASPDQLLEYVRSFSNEWGDEFQEFIEESHKENLQALVDARRLLAHGEAKTFRLTHALQWADSAIEIGKWFRRKFMDCTCNSRGFGS